MPIDPNELFAQSGVQRDVDPLMMQAIANVESKNRNYDANGNPVVSPTGAKGRMQFTGVGRPGGTGYRYGVTDPYNDQQSIPAATRLMNDNLNAANGDVARALTMYNGGGDPNYAQKVFSEWKKLKDAQKSTAQPAASPSGGEDDPFWSQLGAKPTAPATAAPSQGATPSPANDESFWSQLGAQGKGQNPDGPPGKPGQIDPVTGQPFQFASGDNGSPVAQSLGKPIANDQLPGPVTQAIASLPTDPEQKRRVVAAQLFPGMPPKEAQSRVFYGTDNRLAAVGKDGNPFYVEPQSPSLSNGATFAPANLLAYAASGAGEALPMAGGLVGGLVTGPGSLAVGPAAAGAGAAIGDVGRQYLARLIDPATGADRTPINLAQTGREAGLAAVGQLGGAVVNRLASPNSLRVAPRDINTLRTPGVMDEARAAYDTAAAQGVPLTPGQATGLPSLLQYEDAATTMPGTVDTATQFYRNQGNQLQQAGQNMLAGISPVTNKTEGGQLFQQGADDAITAARSQANAAARPSYNAAQAGGQVMSPDLAQLAQQPAVQSAMDRARVTYQNLYRTPAPDVPDFRLWDLTKRSLDDMHSAAVRNADGLSGRTTAAGIDSLRSDLVTHLDAAYPAYETARATAAPGQRLAARLEDSGTGTVAAGVGSERAQAITAPIFNQNPAAISESRAAFAAAGRGDEWNAGVRSYVQNAIDKASMSQQGLNPSMLLRNVWNNQDVRGSLEAAMTPQQFEGFSNFLDTVEKTARTFPTNSLTATRLGARGALADAAANTPGVKAIDTIGALTSLSSYANMGNILAGKARNALIRHNTKELVASLFSNDGLYYLEQMAQYSPGSQRAVEAAANIVGRSAPRLTSALSGNEQGQLPPPPANLLLQSAGPQP